ncbi:MAG: helix-turn-helix transcriptional regulator [Methanosarcinales archaeon]|nr:helix-turn-helix transcriptional regulator [Methanosarcinales archaeon]
MRTENHDNDAVLQTILGLAGELVCPCAEKDCDLPDPAVIKDMMEKYKGLVGEKETIIYIGLLVRGGMGFNEMKRMLPWISPKTLSERLKRLVSAGLVNRDIISDQPFMVRYSLTEAGREIAIMIRVIGIILRKHDISVGKNIH